MPVRPCPAGRAPAACVLVPWQRFGPLAPLVIPVLDLAAIGLLRDGTTAGLPDPGVLSVLPVVWISASRLSAPASLSLSFSVPLLAALPWLVTDRSAPLAARTAEAVLVPLMMLAVSLAMRFARARLRHEQWRIKSKEAELEVLLADSRERERLLNTILDTVDVGIVAVDAGGRRLLTNTWQTELEESAAAAPRPTAEPAGEVLPEEEGRLVLTGQDRSTPLPLERRPIRRALAGESFADYLVCFGEAAASRVVSTGARPLKNDADDFRGAVVVFNEVTGLVDALAAKDEVVSTVSHEFRTPLTSIIGNLDLVLADTEGLDSPVVRRVEVAQRNAERLLALDSDLLMSASAARPCPSAPHRPRRPRGGEPRLGPGPRPGVPRLPRHGRPRSALGRRRPAPDQPGPGQPRFQRDQVLTRRRIGAGLRQHRRRLVRLTSRTPGWA